MLATLAGHPIDAAHQFGEEFAIEIGQHHANGIGPPAAQAPGRCMRGVAQSRRHLQHQLAHGLGNIFMAIECARDRGNRDTGFTGDIFDSDRCLVHFAALHGLEIWAWRGM